MGQVKWQEMMGVFDYKLLTYLFYCNICVNKIIQSLMTKYWKIRKISWGWFLHKVYSSKNCVLKGQNNVVYILPSVMLQCNRTKYVEIGRLYRVNSFYWKSLICVDLLLWKPVARHLVLSRNRTKYYEWRPFITFAGSILILFQNTSVWENMIYSLVVIGFETTLTYCD